jgi:hypothetical protein
LIRPTIKANQEWIDDIPMKIMNKNGDKSPSNLEKQRKMKMMKRKWKKGPDLSKIIKNHSKLH